MNECLWGKKSKWTQVNSWMVGDWSLGKSWFQRLLTPGNPRHTWRSRHWLEKTAIMWQSNSTRRPESSRAHPHSVTCVNLSGLTWCEDRLGGVHRQTPQQHARSPRRLPRTGVGVIRLIQELISFFWLHPGCLQLHRSITYRKLIKTSVLLVPLKNSAELCACQDYSSEKETRRHPDVGAVHQPSAPASDVTRRALHIRTKLIMV